MNRISNAYIRCGWISNPTERVSNPTGGPSGGKSDRADYYKHKHLSEPAFPALDADIQRFEYSFPAPNPEPNRHVVLFK